MSGDTWIGETDMGENFSDPSCATLNIQGASFDLPYSSNFINILRSFQAIFYFIILVAGIVLNTAVIALVAKYQKLKTLSFAIVLQVVALDVVMCLSVYLLRPITAVANRWMFSGHICAFTGYIFISVLMIRVLLMGVQVMDRFFSAFFPYSYPSKRSRMISIFSTITWAVPLAFFMLGFHGILDCFGFVPVAFICKFSPTCGFGCDVAIKFFLAVTFIPFIIVSIIFYALLYWKARRLNKSQITVPPPLTEDGSVPEDGTRVHIKEWKATIMFFSLFLSGSLLTIPIDIFTVLVFHFPDYPSPFWFSMLSILFTLNSLLIVIDPVIILCHRDVRAIMTEIKTKIAQRFNSPPPAAQPGEQPQQS